MDRESFKRGIRYHLEKEIFENEKDCPISNAENFRKRIKEKYNYTPDSNLYRRISNYQTLTYGEIIDTPATSLHREECLKRALQLRTIKYRRLGKRR